MPVPVRLQEIGTVIFISSTTESLEDVAEVREEERIEADRMVVRVRLRKEVDAIVSKPAGGNKIFSFLPGQVLRGLFIFLF